MVQGNEVKGEAAGESLRKMRLTSLPHNPHISVLILTQSGEGKAGSGTSTSLIVARGP
jgi:hypothetical protein